MSFWFLDVDESQMVDANGSAERIDSGKFSGYNTVLEGNDTVQVVVKIRA